MRLYNSISWALLRGPKPRASPLFTSRAQWRWLQSRFSAANGNYRLEVGEIRTRLEADTTKVMRRCWRKVPLPLWARRATETGRMPTERLRLLMVSLPSGDGL